MLVGLGPLCPHVHPHVAGQLVEGGNAGGQSFFQPGGHPGRAPGFALQTHSYICVAAPLQELLFGGGNQGESPPGKTQGGLEHLEPSWGWQRNLSPFSQGCGSWGGPWGNIFGAFSETLQILCHMGPRGCCTARTGLAAGTGCPELIPPRTRGQDRGLELPKLGPSAEPGSSIPVPQLHNVPLHTCHMVPLRSAPGLSRRSTHGCSCRAHKPPPAHADACATLSPGHTDLLHARAHAPGLPMHPCLL